MEWLFVVLIPLAVLSGWWAGKRSQGHGRSFRLSADYYKGINFLLNEKPDKALDVFLRLVEVDSETIETHITLGNIFRKRGEVDKAIRVHQNLIARPSLSPEERYLGMLELAKDYMAAGLLDRAESLLIDVSQDEKYRKPALLSLREIYIQENDWEKAISTTTTLVNEGELHQRKLIAHFYCEQAKEATRNGHYDKAIEILKRAHQYDGYALRANYMRGDIEFHFGNYADALGFYVRVVELEVRFAPEVLPKLEQCVERVNSKRLSKQLDALYESLKADGVHLSHLVTKLREKEGVDAAKGYLSQVMDKDPSLASYKDWLDLHPISVPSDEAKQLIETLIQTSNSYHCSDCGYNSRKLQWQCPSCQSWGTIFPTQH